MHSLETQWTIDLGLCCGAMAFWKSGISDSMVLPESNKDSIPHTTALGEGKKLKLKARCLLSACHFCTCINQSIRRTNINPGWFVLSRDDGNVGFYASMLSFPGKPEFFILYKFFKKANTGKGLKDHESPRCNLFVTLL